MSAALKTPASAPADPAAEVAVARARIIAAKGALKRFEDQAADVRADLDRRRTALPKLAADGAAFREAVAYISAEEDRKRALNETLIPDAKAELDLAEHAYEAALGTCARAQARAAMEQKLAPAMHRVVKTMQQLARDWGELDRVKSEIRGTVTDPRAGSGPSGALAEMWLLWFMPTVLRSRFYKWSQHFADPAIGAKTDIEAWLRERLGGGQ